MSSQAYADRLAKAIETTGLAQPVRTSFADTRINILCRVPEGTEKQWIELIRTILIVEQKEATQIHGWKSHICRHYFLKEVNEEDKLVWGWNISIQSMHMTYSLDVLIPLLRGKQVVEQSKELNRDIVEVPLGGSLNKEIVKGKGVREAKSNSEFHPTRRE